VLLIGIFLGFFGGGGGGRGGGGRFGSDHEQHDASAWVKWAECRRDMHNKLKVLETALRTAPRVRGRAADRDKITIVKLLTSDFIKQYKLTSQQKRVLTRLDPTQSHNSKAVSFLPIFFSLLLVLGYCIPMIHSGKDRALSGAVV